jgi:2-succinyl-5-enolpyruvyl-6-hydroxy-3-cyclohexene-1-carboxylate synthase
VVNLQPRFVATLVDEWARAGVRHAVVCPGSRSTPLTLALERDPRIEVHVRLDERSAAFFALGISLGGGCGDGGAPTAAARPAVLVTTSGTAAAEIHAAVVEAHEARVPLIVCTADRPVELHGVGAAQTVEQHQLFAGSIRFAFSPGVAAGLPEASWRSIASRLVAEARFNPSGPGPVHCNLAFVDPLAAPPGEEPLPAGRPGGAPWHRVVTQSRYEIDPAELMELGALISPRHRGVIVAGAGAIPRSTAVAGDEATASNPLLELAHRIDWPVLAEWRSGCRVDDEAVVSFSDAILRSEDAGVGHAPETILCLGAPPVSKVVQRFIGRSAAGGATVVLADPFGAWPDPDRVVAISVRAAGADLARSLLAGIEGEHDAPAGGSWMASFRAGELCARDVLDVGLDGASRLSEPACVRAVVQALPIDARLFVGSSMPLRDLEWFVPPGPVELEVLANRGANGIDGLVSTARGVAAVSGERPVIGMLGDLAFLHDAGGLARSRSATALERCGEPTFVVLDNGGGGIFSFLEQSSLVAAEPFERLFRTPQQVDCVEVARVYGWPASAVATTDELGRELAAALESGGGRVIVARVDEPGRNVELHDELFAAVAKAIAGGRGRG